MNTRENDIFVALTDMEDGQETSLIFDHYMIIIIIFIIKILSFKLCIFDKLLSVALCNKFVHGSFNSSHRRTFANISYGIFGSFKPEKKNSARIAPVCTPLLKLCTVPQGYFKNGDASDRL